MLPVHELASGRGSCVSASPSGLHAVRRVPVAVGRLRPRDVIPGSRFAGCANPALGEPAFRSAHLHSRARCLLPVRCRSLGEGRPALVAGANAMRTTAAMGTRTQKRSSCLCCLRCPAAYGPATARERTDQNAEAGVPAEPGDRSEDERRLSVSDRCPSGDGGSGRLSAYCHDAVPLDGRTLKARRSSTLSATRKTGTAIKGRTCESGLPGRG